MVDLSATSLLDTLNGPPGISNASFSLPKVEVGGKEMRLLTDSKSLRTVVEVGLWPCRICLRTTMAAQTTRVRVMRPRMNETTKAAGIEGLTTEGLSLYSHRVPMKPCGHWQTGPEKWV